MGRLYGISKVHKTGCPVRPIVSMINTPEYRLARHLDKEIKPHVPNKYSISSNVEFLNRLKEFELNEEDLCMSFDIVSLFTNVPLEETINIIANDIYPEDANLGQRSSLMILLKSATGGMFTHRGQVYQQKDGVSMGNPLAPTLANYFLGHLEKSLFAEHNDSNPALYVRYVDDIFVIFRKGVSFKPFYERLNNLHRNIKFTYEIGGNQLPFLDVAVTLSTSGLRSTVHRKKTDTNVILNYKAVAPTTWKRGLIKCFLHRAKTVCSDNNLLEEEIENLKVIFQQNGYPVSFFEKIKSEFLNKDKESKPVEEDVTTTTEKEGTTTEENETTTEEDKNPKKSRVTILKIPYIGKTSTLFARRLKKLLTQYPEFQVIYETRKIQDSFQLKDDQPKEILSKIVYKFTCSGDPNVQYIGHTKRSLRERFLEHRRGGTAIGDHMSVCADCSNKGVHLDNFEIVKRCRTKTESLIYEALLIKQGNPSLNRQLVKIGHTFHLQVFN